MHKQITNIDRRNFLRLSGITGVGLALGFSTKANGSQLIENLATAGGSYELSPFVVIESTGQITIFNRNPEIGQELFNPFPHS